jgi:hypothetical protein
MKPLNTEERKKSFASFLLFFLITVLLIIGAVYFGMQVPFKQNERLKAQVARYQQEQAFAENFTQKMVQTSILLDSVNKGGTQATIVDGLISEQIKGLNASLVADSGANQQLYQNIVQALNQLQLAKSGLRASSGKDQDATKLQQELTQVKMDYATCQQQLIQYQQILRSNNSQPAQQPR